MADEDEVDVLGDFSLDNLLAKNVSEISSCYDASLLTHQNVELLNCDYSIQPSWLLENPNANSDIWYSNSDSVFNPEDGNSETNTSLGFDEVICTEEKSLDDSGWTEDEKLSLQKGLEIYGKNVTHLSQFIGTKTSSEIKFHLNHYLNNCVKSLNSIYNSVEIAEKTKHSSSRNKKSLSSVFKMSEIIEDSEIPASIEEVIAAVSTGMPTVQNIGKGKSSSKRNFNLPTFKKGQSLLKRKFAETIKQSRKRLKPSKTNQQINIINGNQKKDKILPVSTGEELIKITKEDLQSESDIDIDIDTDDTENCNGVDKKVDEKNCNSSGDQVDGKEHNIEDNVIESQGKETVANSEQTENINESKLNDRLKLLDKTVLDILTSNEIPTKECILEEEKIDEVEKFIHLEFFEGRPTKTPSRYLKIRNYIINHWNNKRPSYCTKVSVRQGLRNCGDVNCIGRIHQYLEQIGAINFNCAQVNYIRPLLKLVSSTGPKEKILPSPKKSEMIRPRMKKKYNHDGEGGYTMMHDENGEVIDTTVVNQDKQSKPKNKRQNIKLVHCKAFTDDNMAPYVVKLHLSALLLMDLHAHSALIEVIGLLGGTFDRNNGTLYITRYVPCRGIDHSNTHCDMCPVSQSEAFEILNEENLEVVGWFHSHPTFYPNPSLQDIDTQLNMQQYLSTETKPFVGVILSPFRDLANSLASEFRCLIVNNKESTKDGIGVPYRFQIQHISNDFNVNMFLEQVRNMFSMETNIPEESIVDFKKPYYYDHSMSYLDKVLASIKLHLAKCTEINKMTCDAIVGGIRESCLNGIYQK